MSKPVLTITVLIPTYRRPRDLGRCLEALRKQSRVPDEVLLVVRDSDAETWALLEETDPGSLTLRTVTVTVPGQVAALNAGLDRARGDIVAITDDDAAPRSDWLARIHDHFQADLEVGGVGGRDWVHHGEQVENGARKVVGKVQWFGRVIGNHHLGVGGPREVDVLKGVNMSYRREAICGVRFDQRLRGSGAQVHNDSAFSLVVKRSGWKFIYDPAVTVDHYPAFRLEGGPRNHNLFHFSTLQSAAHNETLSLLEHLPLIRRVAFMTWAVLVGTRSKPGLAQWLRFLPCQKAEAGQQLRASLRGRWEGWKTWRRS